MKNRYQLLEEGQSLPGIGVLFWMEIAVVASLILGIGFEMGYSTSQNQIEERIIKEMRIASPTPHINPRPPLPYKSSDM